jgi:DUF971 family protein
MTLNTVAQKERQQEGMLMADPQGVVVAWRDGQVRRFSWALLRHLSVCDECQQQSVHPHAIAQPVTPIIQ